jgi:MarR-like DNA-binding transcriptional regulator SgrR of sgrS sRNA
VWPDGLPVRAGDLLAAWSTALLDGGSDLHWLFEPLGGDAQDRPDANEASGRMRSAERILEICPERPTPDLPLRFEHPASWLQRVDPATGILEGPGPFQLMPDGRLAAKSDYPGDGPYLRDVVPLVVEGHSPLLLRLGDAHVAVTFGHAAADLEADPVPDMRLDPLPAWDRTYFMWMNPTERWVNDPVFRRWVAGTIDRDEMVSYLFEDRGNRAFSLSPDGSSIPVYPLRADRPLSPMTEPRLQMVYDAADPYSETVAQRVQAVLETQQVELSLVPMERGELRQALRAGDVEVALLAHRPGSVDPVLALEGTLWWLGEGAADARASLIEASGIEPRQRAARAEAAWKAEELLLADARVIPLIRLHAWLAYHSSLAGLDPGAEGEFRLEEAWWLP